MPKTLTLKFKNQQFQTDAARAVTDAFRGQRNQAMLEFTHDVGRTTGMEDLFDVVGFRNQPLTISGEQLLENIRAIQIPAQLKPSTPATCASPLRWRRARARPTPTSRPCSN